MDNDESSKKDPMSELISVNFGTLYAVAVYQARATMTLAKALENDPSVSTGVKEAAKTSLRIIEAIIASLETTVDNKEVMSAIKKGAGFND
ncbi:hypothetical protein D3C76_1529130 [compost metagenome]